MTKPPSRIPAYKSRREQAAAARAERTTGQEKTANVALEDAKKLLQGATLFGANILGSNISNSNFSGADLPDEAQFIATIGVPVARKWDRPLATEAWATVQAGNKDFQTTLKEADARIKAARPKPLPQQDPQQFSNAWLQQVCRRAEVARAMLRRESIGYRTKSEIFAKRTPSRIYMVKLPEAITDTTLRKWIKTHPECQPYQALAEQAIQSRRNPRWPSGER